MERIFTKKYTPMQPAFKETIHNEIIKEVKRRLLEESVPRLKKCLGELSEAEIWYRPNEQTVSMGNLVIHLCGNVRQWLLTGLGKEPDHRKRDEEFSEKGPIPTDTLIADLEAVMGKVETLLDNLAPEVMIEKHRVQGYDESGIGILLHVVEHFSYHVGQVTYFVKSTKNMDMKYYDGQDLNKTN
jgi:uncharacterized damage-inducible protein DinB